MTLTTYHNFDLLLTRSGARYRAIVVDAPAGEDRWNLHLLKENL